MRVCVCVNIIRNVEILEPICIYTNIFPFQIHSMKPSINHYVNNRYLVVFFRQRQQHYPSAHTTRGHEILIRSTVCRPHEVFKVTVSACSVPKPKLTPKLV
jgi:hypothetical protein